MPTQRLASLGFSFSIKTLCEGALRFNSLPLFFGSSFGNVGGVVELNFRYPADCLGK
jgi:hypothetical protein